ncbi:hypothetical protein BD413DRAFT_608745 [Trametes elegans]|nr:hypothetical protein BD413DRAFT_608745 [Trametes elegans]
MVLSANNRKSFPLNLAISPLARSSSRDPSAPQPDRSSPSRVSYLSPRSPLLPSSLHLKQEQPVIPIPLSDGLDPSERMKLLRKSRKLSRILGEVPIPVPKDGPSRPADSRSFSVLEEPPLTSASTAPSSSPAKTPLEADAKGSLRRSATVGHHRHTQHTKIHRARSLASLRSSLTIPPAAITVHPSPISPVVFAWPEQNSIPPSPFSVETPSEGYAPDSACSPRDSITSESSRRSSITSTIFGAERTPEQIQRARAAKLTRQLGDNVPPDVLLRASSPPPRSPLSSPSVVSFAQASRTIQHASSTRRANRGERRDLKRPLSLDVRNYARVPESPEPSPLLSDADRFSTVRLNSKPIFAERKGSAPAAARPYDTDVEESRTDLAQHDSDLDSDFEDGDVREKQRALNVRRARKMLQLFGNDPPPALFQIMNIPPSTPDESISVALSIAHRRNDSRATTVSLPASTLTVPEPRHQQRDSVGSIASSGDNLSPLIFADPGSVPPSQPQTPQPRRDAQFLPPLPVLTPSQDTVFEICRPLSLPTVASSSVQSLSAASSTSVAPSSTDRAPTPPPKDQTPQTSPIRTSFNFSPPPTMWLWSPASAPTPPSPPTAAPAVLPEPAADVHPSDPHFRVRRMRAAKLSRFFGVGLNDIAGVIRGGASASLSTPPPPSPSPPPPLREFRRSDSTDSIPPPAGSDRAPSRTSSTRPVTSSGIVGAPSVSVSIEEEQPWPRARTVSTTTRSRSVSRTSRRPQTQPALQPATERNRSNSEPEVLGPVVHGRAFSTTVEVAAESKGPFGFFDGRRPSKVKELHMHDVIRELRKIK